MDYHTESKQRLLTNLANNPPDTPVWINSQLELQRRREEALTCWTRTLAICTVVLALSTIADLIVRLGIRH